ncbi:hypothetical protein ACNOYE_20330 [Nannocystaceae bacterium ST9]
MQSQILVASCTALIIVAACADGGEDEGSDSFGDGIDDVDDDSETDSTTTSDDTTTTTTDGDSTTTTTEGDTTEGDTTTEGGDIPIEPDNMLDNFEDGDGAIIPNGGRQGYWYVFNDASVGGTQTPAPDIVLPESGGADGTSMAMHTAGSGFAEWGAGIGADINNMGDVKMTWDGSAFTGIVVMARGNGQVRAVVQTEATVPPEEGGTCAIDCDPHGKILLLSDEWQQFTLPFAQLAQEGWGTPAEWDASTIIGIQFKVAKNVDFDFRVDEIGFY